MKLAHLILAHNNPLQLERLAKRLANEHADVYIHLDKKTSLEEYEKIKDLLNVSFIKTRVNVAWGEYSMIRATLAGMEEILATGKGYSHINLLSGIDYPLKSNEAIQAFFFANAGKTFMWHEPIFDGWVHGQARINKYDLGDYGFPGRYVLARVLDKVLPGRKLPNGLVAYGRSQWLTITPECAAYAIKYIKDNPTVERFFRMTWAVDEVFFQTILCNSPLKDKIINDNLRYISIDAGFRPIILGMAHVDALEKSGKLYARKFDLLKSPEILDYLDKK